MKRANHPWSKIQKRWAFNAWANRNPTERQAIEARYKQAKETK